MKRLFPRALVALSVTAAVAAPAPRALAFADQCTNEKNGTPILTGTPTNSPTSQYVVSTHGLSVYVAGVGSVEVFANPLDVGVEVHGPVDAYVGVDPSGGSTYGKEWELAVCASTGSLGGTLYADLDDPDPARTGVVARLFLCSPAGVCTSVLGHTGFELDTAVPANSCVWVNGRQQNLLATCPPVDAL